VADDDVTGTPWTDAELDLIVADYFSMREAEFAGRPYVKARHNAALRERIQRSRGSVEFKYRNISAVLVELAMTWLPGYVPAANRQNSIVDAVDRYLSAHNATETRHQENSAAEATRLQVRSGGKGSAQPSARQSRGRVRVRSREGATREGRLTSSGSECPVDR
jgi:hypothetical protein